MAEAQEVVATIIERLDKLETLLRQSTDVASERFHTWKETTTQILREQVSDVKADRFAGLRGVRQRAAYGESAPPAFLGDAVKARSFLVALKKDIEADPAAVLHPQLTGTGVRSSETSGILKIVDLLERKWRMAVRERPEKEKQVQDAFETLLVGADVQYERETDSIVYSSKTYVPDFSFPTLVFALELKLCNRADREKEIIAEINDDILAYRTRYHNLLFGVYDLGFIRDVDRFAETFEGHPGVMARVVKH